MENASKALIMAAGVLMGVLILSLAVYLFTDFGQKSRDIRDIIERNQIVEFNTRFTKFEGTRSTATIYDVISLAQFAAEYNINNPSNKINVFLNYRNDSGNLSKEFEEYITPPSNFSQLETRIGELITDNLHANNPNPDGKKPIKRYKCTVSGNDYDETGRLTAALFQENP